MSDELWVYRICAYEDSAMNWLVATGYKQTADGTNSLSIYKLHLQNVPSDAGETGVGNE